tara:strand:+ start:101451 stop:101753 length:303 start_codon:yes stop_codon:yes gene_type:complete
LVHGRGFRIAPWRNRCKPTITFSIPRICRCLVLRSTRWLPQAHPWRGRSPIGVTCRCRWISMKFWARQWAIWSTFYFTTKPMVVRWRLCWPVATWMRGSC